MPNFAVVKDQDVLNVIVADSKEVAEQVTGYSCIEVSLEPGSLVEPGGKYVNEIFLPKGQLYPSWIKDENGVWSAPIPKPDNENNYNWNESTLSWNLA